MRIHIRQEEAEDQEAVYAIHAEAFGRTDEAVVAEALRSSSEYVSELSLVAEAEGELVGHIMLTTMLLDDKPERKLLALGPIGVLSRHQRQGIGAALMQAAIEKAKELRYDGIVLIGHPTYYPRFGFVPASRFGIRVPYEVPDDVAMALEIFPGSLGDSVGLARFSPGFAAADSP